MKSRIGTAILLALAMGAPQALLAQLTCDEQANYTFFDSHFPLNASHEHVIDYGDVTWNTGNGNNNMNVHGSIIIENGRTLTIDGVTIRFADSRHMDHLTNIIVRPGGNLVVRNGAVLTTLASCPSSMWDGIKVLGVPDNPETLWGKASSASTRVRQSRTRSARWARASY